MRAIVCGSQYGVYYADALLGLEDVRWVGLLARGSERSRWLAEQAEVPLLRSVDDVPDDVGLACVAVGGEAGEGLGRRLLQRGCHVLQEHPVSPEFLAEALDLAEARGLCFHVNGHFSDLPAPRAFLLEVATLRQLAGSGPGAAPIFGSVIGSVRSLYSLLDILGLALGSLDLAGLALSPSPAAEARCPLTIGLVFGGVPLTLVLQRPGEVDDGSDSVVGHRITLVFPRGDLLLVGAHGPVLSSGHGGEDPELCTWRDVGPPPATFDAIAEIRVEANQRAIRRLLACVGGGPVPPEQSRRHLLGIADAHRAILERVHAHHGLDP